MLARLLAHYPTGSLISELLQIYEGKFVVRVEVQVDGVTRATGMACVENLELAEDRARSRALMVLLPDVSPSSQTERSIQYPTVAGEVQPVVKPSLPLGGADNKKLSSFATTSAWSSSTISSFPPRPTAKESTLAPNGLPKLAMEDYGAQEAMTPVAHAEVAGDFLASMYDVPSENDESALIPFGDEEPANSYDESHESNISSPSPEATTVAEVKKTVNMTDVVARTSTEIKRLGWSNQEGRNYLKTKYGKISRQQLTNSELLEFLEYLEFQPTPNRLPLDEYT